MFKKVLSAVALLLTSQAAFAGCGTGNKEDFYDDLNNRLGGGGEIVMGYQNCGGYTVDKVKFYIRVDGDDMWTTTKTGDLKINEYHIIGLSPAEAGAKVRAALGDNDREIQLRMKIWIRAGEKKSKTIDVPYNRFVAWGTNSNGTTTKNNKVSTRYYREAGYHASFVK